MDLNDENLRNMLMDLQKMQDQIGEWIHYCVASTESDYCVAYVSTLCDCYEHVYRAKRALQCRGGGPADARKGRTNDDDTQTG